MTFLFDTACEIVEEALQGATRQKIVTTASNQKTLGSALHKLRIGFQSNTLQAGSQQIPLNKFIKEYDRLNREEGLHVLHDWDGVSDKVNDNTIPIDVLDYLIDNRGSDQTDRAVLEILVDYYFLYLLALLSLRIWDSGDPDENLDRLDRLLNLLQGDNGSGQLFAENPGTLILIATSHYELEEYGYGTLLEKVRTLNRSNRNDIALSHAACMGGHLRFGFEASYIRDIVLMRNDNTADYPWLCFALSTLMAEYTRLHDLKICNRQRETIVEGLLNGLSPDARAFMGDQIPDSLLSCATERNLFRKHFHDHKDPLLEEAEQHRPKDDSYSPLSLFFNFSQNILKGSVIDALLRGKPWDLTLNDLLTGTPNGSTKNILRKDLAITLMGYARRNPNRIRGRMIPAIVYDPKAGHRAFTITVRKLSSLDTV